MKKVLVKLTLAVGILSAAFVLAPQQENVEVANTDLIQTQSIIGDPGDGGRG